MGLLPDTQNYGLRRRRECRERFPRNRLQKKSRISDPGMHHVMCVRHVPWCMLGSLTRGDRKNVPGIPGTCALPDFTYSPQEAHENGIKKLDQDYFAKYEYHTTVF